MTEDTFQAFEAAIAATPDNRDAYRNAGLSPMRYRWDRISATPYDATVGRAYREGLNDAHIDTALRLITDTGEAW